MNKETMIKSAAVIGSKVYNPVYFASLSKYGIIPNNDVEAAELLKLAAVVKEMSLRTLGYAPTPASDDPEQIKKAFWASKAFLKDNPDVYKAVENLIF